MTEIEYLILVEQGGCGDNDYWTNDGYPWQGTLFNDENGKAVHYRAVEYMSKDDGLYFRDIPRMPDKPDPEWEKMWLGDMHEYADEARRRADMIACLTEVVGAKWFDTTDPHEGCRVRDFFRHPNDGDYAAIVICPKHLKAAFCKHEGLKVRVGDTDVWASQNREYTMRDGADHVFEDSEERGAWKALSGCEKGEYLVDVTCKYCGVVLVEDGNVQMVCPRTSAIIKALRESFLL